VSYSCTVVSWTAPAGSCFYDALKADGYKRGDRGQTHLLACQASFASVHQVSTPMPGPVTWSGTRILGRDHRAGSHDKVTSAGLHSPRFAPDKGESVTR